MFKNFSKPSGYKNCNTSQFITDNNTTNYNTTNNNQTTYYQEFLVKKISEMVVCNNY
jgi:hypothetical protein